MQKILIAISASLVAGVGAGAWLFSSDQEAPGEAQLQAESGDGGISMQIRQLEQDLAAERNARQLLEEQVDELTDKVESFGNGPEPVELDRTEIVSRLLEERSSPRARVTNMIDQAERMREWRLRRFVEGGYTEDEARALMDAESDAQLQAMYEEWEAQRNGEQTNPWINGLNAQDILRERLGDAEYERYLRAQGSTATVQLSSVMERSPGGIAGLQAGDEIVSYNGERTFSMTDLRRLTMQGNPGENVIVEIDRDGVRMQITLPRGPIGVNGATGRAASFVMGTN